MAPQWQNAEYLWGWCVSICPNQCRLPDCYGLVTHSWCSRTVTHSADHAAKEVHTEAT